MKCVLLSGMVKGVVFGMGSTWCKRGVCWGNHNTARGVCVGNLSTA
jgi:hypothetical protein